MVIHKIWVKCMSRMCSQILTRVMLSNPKMVFMVHLVDYLMIIQQIQMYSIKRKSSFYERLQQNAMNPDHLRSCPGDGLLDPLSSETSTGSVKPGVNLTFFGFGFGKDGKTFILIERDGKSLLQSALKKY